jgi:hypothetical protein
MKGRIMSNMIVKKAAKNTKARCKCGHIRNPGAHRLKIMCDSELLIRFWKYVQRKKPERCWQVDSPPWQCPAHTALQVHEFLAKKSITKINYPPYSHYSAHSNFWLISS